MDVSRNQVRIALTIFGAVVLAMLLNRYIVTDKKRIERTMQDMADAAAKRDVDLLFSHVSADFGAEAMTRTHLRSLAEKLLSGDSPAKPRIQWMSVNVSGAQARVQLSVSDGATREYAGWSGATEWAAEFRKEADGAWRVTSLMPVRIFGREISNWRDATRHFE
jgi:ketosteroid isomerase-like protein